MRLRSLQSLGMSLMAVTGRNFDPAGIPLWDVIPSNKDNRLAQAAITSVQRARTISYIERGICPQQSMGRFDPLRSIRDEECLHLIVHRGNCFQGSIRCQFFPASNPKSTLRQTLSWEILSRQAEAEGPHDALIEWLGKGTQCPVYLETSGWLVNPDLDRCPSLLALALPAAVWAMALPIPELRGIATLRASNRAAEMLHQLGAERLGDPKDGLRLYDPYFRGEVELMGTRSTQFHPMLKPLVHECFETLLQRGIWQS